MDLTQHLKKFLGTDDMTVDYASLSEDAKHEIVADSVNLMRTITQHFGPEHGMELWESIANTLGADVKGAVFFSMLTGEHYGDITLVMGSCQMYVEAIKTVRMYTGLGLKEAKDLCDASKVAPVRIALPANGQWSGREKRGQFVADLRKLGCNAR